MHTEVHNIKSMRLMLSAVLLALLTITGFTTGNNTYRDEAAVLTFTPDKAHSRVSFKVRHLGISNVQGIFKDYDATVRLDPENLKSLEVEATVDVGSIDTGVERRDNHLRSDDFFNAEKFPAMKFVSKEVRNLDDKEFELVGDLTIRDITKEVVFDAEFLGAGTMRGQQKAGFEAKTTINRFDYNLKWDNLTEAGGLVVGEDVEIILEMELSEEKKAE